MTRGVLYFAKGNGYIKEAKISAIQLKTVMPDIPVAIVSDKNIRADVFDEVLIEDTEFSKSDKPRALLQSPYERTLYLDADTYMTESVSEIFDHLDQFDLIVNRDQYEYNINQDDTINDVPRGFPEFNTGVLCFNQSESVDQLLCDWKRRCGPEAERDQRSFRSALYHSDVCYSVLPHRYNCIYRFQNHVNGKVKILHGSLIEREGSLLGDYGISISRAANIINKK